MKFEKDGDGFKITFGKTTFDTLLKRMFDNVLIEMDCLQKQHLMELSKKIEEEPKPVKPKLEYRDIEVKKEPAPEKISVVVEEEEFDDLESLPPFKPESDNQNNLVEDEFGEDM